MNPDTIDRAAEAFAQARRSTRPVDPLPDAWLPADLPEAYRLQHAVASRLGAIRGWKVSALTETAQRAMGVPSPVAAPLLAPWVQEAPARFALADFMTPRLECEFAFELAHDLPSRPTPYSRAEVEAAIGALRIVVEVCDSRVPAGRSVWLELADGFNNGAFVVGPAHADWRSVDFPAQAIVLRARDAHGVRELAHGDASPVLGGDPVGALRLMACFAPPGYGGLKAGQIVTTGTCTGAVALDAPAEVSADFGALGQVVLRFD